MTAKQLHKSERPRKPKEARTSFEMFGLRFRGTLAELRHEVTRLLSIAQALRKEYDKPKPDSDIVELHIALLADLLLAFTIQLAAQMAHLKRIMKFYGVNMPPSGAQDDEPAAGT